MQLAPPIALETKAHAVGPVAVEDAGRHDEAAAGIAEARLEQPPKLARQAVGGDMIVAEMQDRDGPCALAGGEVAEVGMEAASRAAASCSAAGSLGAAPVSALVVCSAPDAASICQRIRLVRPVDGAGLLAVGLAARLAACQRHEAAAGHPDRQLEHITLQLYCATLLESLGEDLAGLGPAEVVGASWLGCSGSPLMRTL